MIRDAEKAGEVSSSEGLLVRDLSEFSALGLNDMPPKLHFPCWYDYISTYVLTGICC